ncbi:hypothetical protein [Ruminococcus sp. CAG:330]|uniref:hypothetical protein n=1 Tax=Ruminococcus sp. CAG:330 TaxID=1262954 RepID=UPI00263F94F0|nr:hypothetical protein [Ruminococcus sp. CAG:330]
MDAWDIFCLTGHVDDYLHYRKTLGVAVQPTASDSSKEKPPHGDLSGSGSGTADSRRSGQIH